MGTMRLGGLSIAGKVFIFILICGVIAGGYYGYVSYKYNTLIEKGNTLLSKGNYAAAITAYNSALDAKSFGTSKAETVSLISNVNTLRDSEVTRLKQEIIAVIGDKYGGVEGANTIAIRKGYHSAVEIEPIQKKIDRLKSLNVDNSIIKQYQQILDSQRLQVKRNKR